MSSLARNADWLGDCEDWGLSAARLSELEAELDDHLQCMQTDEGLPATEQARENLKKPASRRKLAGPHLTDQVYATLNRWPTRREWRELAFLLACFTLILLSDWLALQVSRLFEAYQPWWAKAAPPPPGPAMRTAITFCWVLQSAARAAFFAGFIYTLWRAWQLGWGVLLARVLQLKLIHTVLVVSALLMLGGALWENYFIGFGYTVPWPLWLTAPAISALLVVLGIAITLSTKGRRWAFGAFAMLTGLFLYAGGPLAMNEFKVTRPIALETQKLKDGSKIAVPSQDPFTIAKHAESVARGWPDRQLDVASNQMSYSEWRFRPLFGIWQGRGRYHAVSGTPYRYPLQSEQSTGRRALTGPVVAPGGGIGWLALPIPFLGLIGLIGLALIMGRRGPFEFLAYSAICVLAIIATILPFVFERTPEEFFALSAFGMLQSPLPAFEELLTYCQLDWTWISLVGGLVFSAGVPWLLAGLFLRPERSMLPPVDEQVAE